MCCSMNILWGLSGLTVEGEEDVEATKKSAENWEKSIQTYEKLGYKVIQTQPPNGRGYYSYGGSKTLYMPKPKPIHKLRVPLDAIVKQARGLNPLVAVTSEHQTKQEGLVEAMREAGFKEAGTFRSSHGDGTNCTLWTKDVELGVEDKPKGRTKKA